MSAPQASKTDLVKGVSLALNSTEATAAKAVDAILEAIGAHAKAGKLIIRGFGTFEVRHKPARTARNIRTGLPVDVPTRSVLTFKAAKAKA